MKKTLAARYHRQELVLRSSAQHSLKHSKVAIVGLGALGSLSAQLLCRSGVDRLTIIDRDLIEPANLSTQHLYCESDLGLSKAGSASRHLKSINSSLIITPHAINLDSSTISILHGHNLILDGTDNLTTRFLINDFAKKNKIPWIYAAAIRKSGYVMPIYPSPHHPCLSCFLRPASLDGCDIVGVLNTITTAIASLQVQLALTILTSPQSKHPLPNLTYLSLSPPNLTTIKIRPSPSCCTCAGKYIYLHAPSPPLSQFCSSGRYQLQITPWNPSIYQNLTVRWKKHPNFTHDAHSQSISNLTLFRDGRLLIKAPSKSAALSLYSRFVGN